MQQPLSELARGRWHGILPQLGIPPDCLRDKHGPCPVCGGKDRFRWDNKDGNGTSWCNSCGATDGFGLLKNFHGWDYPTAAREVERIVGSPDPPKIRKQPTHPHSDPRPALREAYKGSQAFGDLPASNPIGLYLCGRGLNVTPARDVRFHPAMWGVGVPHKLPAMLTGIRDVKGQFVSFHRTFIQGAGKAPIDSPKQIMTPVTTITGAAARLFPCIDELAICEGVETAFAVRELTGLPTWAALTAHGLKTFELPSPIKRLHIYGDCDASFAGQSAAYQLAERLSGKCAVSVHIPSERGDWLDYLVSKKGRFTHEL